MPKPTINLSALIHDEKNTIPVKITYGSRFSFFADFPDHVAPPAGAVFRRIAVSIAGTEYLFGKCEFIPESNIYGYTGRLVFLEDVYDFKSLIFEKKVVSLETTFQNLPLILSQKDKIRQSFKDYTSNLTYDLEVYKSFFDDLDNKYADEPFHVYEILQNTIIEREGRLFMDFFDQKLAELRSEVDSYTREEHENHGFYFRKQVWDFILCSEIFTRTNRKPRGYAGDSEMLSMIYENGLRGKSTFCKLMHKHPVSAPAAQAVRNRRTLISDQLRAFGEEREWTPANPLRVMSVACGAAVELADVFRHEIDFDRYAFTLFDQDVQALSESGRNAERVEEKFHRKMQLDFINASVRTMLHTPQVSSAWGRYHFIYSMGLFDYLTPPVAKAVIEKLYDMLKPGGVLLIGNFHPSNPDRYYMEYWLDWVLYYRTEEEFLDLVSRLKVSEKSIQFEDTGSQLFLKIRKAE